MEGRKRIAVVGSDARQAAAGRALAGEAMRWPGPSRWPGQT